MGNARVRTQRLDIKLIGAFLMLLVTLVVAGLFPRQIVRASGEVRASFWPVFGTGLLAIVIFAGMVIFSVLLCFVLIGIPILIVLIWVGIIIKAACRRLEITLFVNPPRCPEMNGGVERSNRTSREEFYEVEDLALVMEELNRQLEGWEYTYNYVRPHQTLDYLITNVLTPFRTLTHFRSSSAIRGADGLKLAFLTFPRWALAYSP